MREFVLLSWKSKKNAFVDILAGFNKDHVYIVYFKVHPKYIEEFEVFAKTKKESESWALPFEIRPFDPRTMEYQDLIIQSQGKKSDRWWSW